MNSPVTPQLEITGLSRAFDGVPALQNVDLTVSRGESVVLIGESGSGWTGLQRMSLL